MLLVSYVHTCFLTSGLIAQSLQVDAPRHDFGKVLNTTKATHGFKLTNGGDKDLVIANVRPSCGCTSVVTGKSTLAPKESTTIEATFTPGGAGGHVEKTIQVASNDPKNSTMILTLVAEVQRDLYTEPPGATFFEMPRTGTRDLSLRLKSDTGEVKLEGVDASATPYATVTPRTQEGQVFLDVHLDASRLPKEQAQGSGTFQVKNAKDSLQVPIMWSLARVYHVVPDRISLHLEVGRGAKGTFRISRPDGKPFRVLELLSSNPSLKAELPKNQEAGPLEIAFDVAPDLKPGTQGGMLTLRLDDPEEPELRVPVYLLVQAPPAKEAVKGRR